MNKISLTIALLAFVPTGFAQTCDQPAPPEDVKKMSALVGTWTGEFEYSGKKHKISFMFLEENQELKAHITNAAHTSAGYTADASLCSVNKFHFFGTKVTGEYFTYHSRLVDGELVGVYKIGRVCSKDNQGTFKLQKTKT